MSESVPDPTLYGYVSQAQYRCGWKVRITSGACLYLGIHQPSTLHPVSFMDRSREKVAVLMTCSPAKRDRESRSDIRNVEGEEPAGGEEARRRMKMDIEKCGWKWGRVGGVRCGCWVGAER